ncbi:dTDP-4-dehydrorhamnose reductase [Pseudooctadecabacter jejudonensis]|uniref:dTDP-4-dehydrorhamnose reductase n=1 Tax=Pseudooctadecabacter jejudonensis TaxID=1391910 RepID=A0A1Y5TDJ9_9RHOB|nr:dTDP-4-dehydrorhamnose reductase [Pseudooctadecabacter jejudonensis]SLN61774.1 dTDP-4-dehydrorhamnose reductase [Pseudooctadecabacter jejudonensis]
MHVLVFGQTGQVAQALQDCAVDKPGLMLTFLNRAKADLTDPTACAEAIQRIRPDAVINAAAYTNVDAAESNPKLAEVINSKAPAAMTRACAGCDIPFVTLSSDYVFDGQGNTPWTPKDTPAPLNIYGLSKCNGENAVRDAGGRWAVLRTSWVFSEHGTNFVKTMLRLAKDHETLRVVDDQIGGPTCASDIASACLTIASKLARDPMKSGIYHFSGYPDVSWADFARAVFDLSGQTCIVEPITTADYPTAASRPLNSRLDCRATTDIFGIERPDWRKALSGVLKELDTAAP